MPPTFAYAMGLVIYFAIATCILAIALVFLLFTATRRTAYRAILCVFGSFPGMIIHQILGFPVTIIIILLGGGVAYAGKALGSSEWVWFIVIPVLFLSIIWFAASSAYGIYVGARVVWRITDKISIKRALREHFTTALLARFLG